MTNNNSNRLDRIEDDLETVKEILVAVARRAESTDERLDRLTQGQERTQVQLDQLSGSVNQLNEDVEIAFQTIKLMAENSDREMAEFRSAILGLQTENRHMWEYLMRRDRDGNGGGSQP